MRGLIILLLLCAFALAHLHAHGYHARSSSLHHRRNLTSGMSKRSSPAPGMRKRGESRRCRVVSSSSSSSSATPTTTSSWSEPSSTWTGTSSTENNWTTENTWTEQNTWTENTWTEQPATTTSTTDQWWTWQTTSTSTTDWSSETGSSGGSSGESHTGEATFYSTGLGACGITNVDTDYICAVSIDIFDNYPGYDGNSNNNPICNKQIQATYQGKTVTVTVTDRCEGCATNDLDFSPSAFSQLADQSAGRLTGMTWVYL